MAIPLISDEAGVRLNLKVVPGASRDRIVGQLGDALKIAVAKAPENGAANRAVIKILAAALKLPEANLSIIRGQTNPRKQILITDVSIEELSARLSQFTDG